MPANGRRDLIRRLKVNSVSPRTRRKFCTSTFLYCQVLVKEQYFISYYRGYKNIELKLKNWSQRRNRKHSNVQRVFILLWAGMRALMSAFEPAGMTYVCLNCILIRSVNSVTLMLQTVVSFTTILHTCLKITPVSKKYSPYHTIVP